MDLGHQLATENLQGEERPNTAVFVSLLEYPPHYSAKAFLGFPFALVYTSVFPLALTYPSNFHSSEALAFQMLLEFLFVIYIWLSTLL